MNIDDWKKIKQKYFKSYSKFCEPRYISISRNDICYCDIEKFFDDNGIEILIDSKYDFDLKEERNKKRWFFRLLSKASNFYLYKSATTIEQVNYISRDEAKEQAIYKAFEILEDKLK